MANSPGQSLQNWLIVNKGAGLTRRFVLGSSLAVVATPAIVRAGSLKRSVGNRGTMAFRMGVNLAGLESSHVYPGVAHHDYFPPTTAELDYYHSKGINTVRLPFRAERIQPIIGGALDPVYLGFLTALVDYAGTVGMKVVLDMHNYGIWGSPTSYTLGGMYKGVEYGNWTIPMFTDLWTQLATAFVGKPGLGGYDLMNEPSGRLEPKPPTLTLWASYAQAAVNAIAVVDKTGKIYVEGLGALVHSWPGWNPHFPLTDPNGQIIYSGHVYLDHDDSGTHSNWATEAALGVTFQTGTFYLTPFVNWLEQHNVTGHIGEIGVPNNDPNWLTALDATLAYLMSAVSNIESVHYWAGGPAWGTYPLSCEPVSGVDTPQMSVMLKYV